MKMRRRRLFVTWKPTLNMIIRKTIQRHRTDLVESLTTNSMLLKVLRASAA